MSKTGSALGILTTAAAGAAMMYLLDPEKGQQRRDKLGGAASDALSAAGNYAGETWGTIADKVNDVAGDLQDRASDFASNHDGMLKGQVGKLAAYASMIGSKLSDRASNWRENAASAANRATDQAAEYLAPERSGPSPAAFGACGIGSLLLGAGLMYFLDPNLGRGRRSRAADKITACCHDVGDMASRTGRHLRNKTYGWSHHAYSAAESMVESVSDRLQGQQGGDTGLVDLVRSRLSDLFPSTRNLQINADDGMVTLHGSVPAEEYDRIVECVRAFPGVTQVNNQLQTVGA